MYSKMGGVKEEQMVAAVGGKVEVRFLKFFVN
jgi:hypothetical protein